MNKEIRIKNYRPDGYVPSHRPIKKEVHNIIEKLEGKFFGSGTYENHYINSKILKKENEIDVIFYDKRTITSVIKN